jgi:transcriptional regulator with XRE-family HTH domain
VFEIGNTLREARVRRNLTLQQVEEDIKIRVKYVQAMENEDWDVMPGVTYVKGFLRTYSTYLGLDPDVVVGEFRSRAMVPSQEHHQPFGGSSVIGKPRGHRGRNTIVIVAIVCLIALAVIYVVGLVNGRESQEPTTQPGALGIASPSPSPSPSRTATPKASPTGIPAWQKNLIKVEATDGDCWMEVRRNSSTGVVLFSGTLKKGALQKFKGKDVWMSLGAPGNVRLNVQGKNIKLKSATGPWPVEIIQGRVVQGSDVQG